LKLVQILEILTCRGFRGGEVRIGSIFDVLSRQCRDGQQQTERYLHGSPLLWRNV
jgi:hypothetical protein